MSDLMFRFMRRVPVAPEWACWEWEGSLDTSGYGCLSLHGSSTSAHRLAYELFVEEIPEGLQLDHLCRTRHCVNPYHLEPVTQRENILRGEGLAAKQARRDKCVRGHPYTPENTYLRRFPSGRVRQRVCRTCKRAANLEYKRRKRQIAGGQGAAA